MERFKAWLDQLEIDFVSRRHIAGAISAMLVLISWALFAGIGPNWGIDFTGGTEIHLRFERDVPIEDVREALGKLGLSEDSVQSAGSADAHEFKVRIQDPEFGMEDLSKTVRERLVATFGESWIQDLAVSAEVGARFTVTYAGEEVSPLQVEAALAGMEGVRAQPGRDTNLVVITVPGLSSLVQQEIAEVLGDEPFEVLSIEAVGPKVGGDLRRQGFVSIVATLALVLVYVAFRFDLAFAPGAVIALIHDVSITMGMFVLLDLEFSLPMIGALLTIVGYSLNDTIVVFDRIRENRDRYRRGDLKELINRSISETITRTTATSGTTMLAITMFLFYGGPVIRNFALALYCGIIFGTYSTIFIASPMILIMEDLKPYLSRFVALPELPGLAPEPAEGEPDAAGELTESEKRRRERAEAERKQNPGA